MQVNFKDLKTIRLAGDEKQLNILLLFERGVNTVLTQWGTSRLILPTD